MPYLFEDEDEKALQTAGESTQFTAPPGSQTEAPKPGKSSGRYANLSKYLEANKEQAAQMGQKIAGGIEEKGQAATKGIETLGASAPKATTLDPSKYLQAPETLGEEEQKQYKEFKQTGGYSGPSDVSGVAGYKEASGALEAGKRAKAAETEEGQLTLLQKQYERPTYQRGQQTLDQLLMQGSTEGKQALSDVSQRYKGLESLFETTAGETGKAIGTAQKQALASKQAVSEAEKKAWADLLSPIDSRAAQANIDNPALVKRVQEDIQDEVLNPETMALLGLKGGEYLYDLDLSAYMRPDLTQVGVDQAANPEERAKYAALAGLIEDPTRTQITKEGRATTPVSFESERFAQDVGKKGIEEKGIIKKQFAETMALVPGPWKQGVNSVADVGKKLDELENPVELPAPSIDSGENYDEANNARIAENEQNQKVAEVIKKLRLGIPLPPEEKGYDHLKAMVGLEKSYQKYLNPRRVQGGLVKSPIITEETGPLISIGKG